MTGTVLKYCKLYAEQSGPVIFSEQVIFGGNGVKLETGDLFLRRYPTGNALFRI